MKKLLLLFVIIGLSSIATSLKASHYAGAELTYKCLGGISYKITLTLYRDCSGIAAPTNVNINFLCKSNSNLNFYTPLNPIPVTGNEITQTCPSASTTCNNGNNYGLEEYVYEGIVQLAPCDEWIMSYSSCCRNPVTNVINNSSNDWYVQAKLNNLDAPCNSSPVFDLTPSTVICQIQNLNYNSGAYDSDGDSLVYSFYNPMTTDSNSTISYAGAFTYNNFLASSSPITINPNTGDINMTPTMIGSTVFGVKVEEWRNINGVPKKIGTIYRDMQVMVDNCNSSTPVLSGMDTSLTHTYNPNDTIFHLISCSNQAVSFDINGFDADIANSAAAGNPENFSISWNNGIPDATFTPYYNGTDSAYANFTWYPGYFANYKDIQCFTATITDEACPYTNSRSYNYCISVIKTYVSISNDAGICEGESKLLIAHSDSNTVNYRWFLDGVFTGNNLSDSTFLFDSDTLTPGSYLVEVEVDNGGFSPNCPAYDNASIYVSEKPQLNIPDTVLNTPNGVILDAGPADYYEWRRNGFVLSFNRYFSPKVTGDYLAIVNPYTTNSCRDSAHFYFDLSTSIQVNEDGKFNIYPNPIKDKVFIEFVENIKQESYFEIYDLAGKLVLKEALNSGESKFSIDVNKLNSGVYTYQIQSEETYRGKIVIIE